MESKLLQIPIRIRWQGWTSDTLTLRRFGWGIFANEQPSQYKAAHVVTIGLKSPHDDFLIAGSLEVPIHDFLGRDSEARLMELLYHGGFEMQGFKSSDRVITHGLAKGVTWDALESLDYSDGFATISDLNIRDLKIFRSSDESREIFIPQMSVDDCLNEILKIQYPLQKELKKEAKMSKPVIQAKIYSLAA